MRVWAVARACQKTRSRLLPSARRAGNSDAFLELRVSAVLPRPAWKDGCSSFQLTHSINGRVHPREVPGHPSTLQACALESRRQPERRSLQFPDASYSQLSAEFDISI